MIVTWFFGVVLVSGFLIVGCSDGGSEIVPPDHHQNFGDYTFEVRMVDNNTQLWSIYTDIEPEWLAISPTPVLRINNFRRGDIGDYKPKYGVSIEILPDKDQRLEVIKRR